MYLLEIRKIFQIFVPSLKTITMAKQKDDGLKPINVWVTEDTKYKLKIKALKKKKDLKYYLADVLEKLSKTN